MSTPKFRKPPKKSPMDVKPLGIHADTRWGIPVRVLIRLNPPSRESSLVGSGYRMAARTSETPPPVSLADERAPKGLVQPAPEAIPFFA